MGKIHETTPIMPHITVSDGATAVAFYQKAFGAKELYRAPAEDGKRLMHAAMEVNGGGIFMLNDDFPEFRDGRKSTPESFGGTPTTLHLEQETPKAVDALYNRAIKAGAKPAMPPEDMFWGDRYAMVTDPFGHRWSFAAPLSE